MSIHHASAARSNLDHRPSQSSSRRHPPSANNVRVNPASSEVISSLLASLSSVSLPSEDPSPLIPNDAPTSPVFPPSSWTSARPSARPSISQRPPSSRSYARDSTNDLVEPPHPLSPQETQSSVQSDAAEPPTIRTARPPSGLSKLTAPRASRRIATAQNTPTGIASALSSFPSPPNSARQSKVRLDGPLPPLPKISADRLRSRSSRKDTISEDSPKPRGFGLQRDSLLLLRSKEKGKEKERPSNANDTAMQAQASASSLPPAISRYRALSPRGAQTSAASRVTSPARSFIATMEDIDDTMPSPSVPMRPRHSEDDFVIVRGSGEPSRRPSFQEKLSKIPSRASSLRDRSSSPPRTRILSRRSSRHSTFQAPETVPEETFASQLIINHEINTAKGGSAASPLAPLSPMSPVTLDEENDVVKRIKQLRAAKEERQRAEPVPKLESAPTSPTAPWSPAMNGGISRPPDTSRALKQLDQADRLEERQVRLKDDDFPRRDASLSPSSSAFAFQPLQSDVANRPSTANPNSPQGAPLSPVLSRSSSAKRWSNPDLTGRRNSLHRRQGSRGQTAPDYPPVPEERRASFDSVKESVTDFLNSPRLSQKIRSPFDNRIISFSEVGDPKGFAVFCCVGMGLTRYVTAFYDELASSLNLRLITPERPGIGETMPYPGQRAPLFWADDVRAICRHLSIRNFSLIAHSAGTIYALATALQMPNRIRGKIHLLAPFIPPSQLSNTGRASANNARAGSLPRSQRLLRLVPTSFLKLTNSSYFAGGRPNGKSSGKGRKSGDSNATSPRPSTSTRAWNGSTPQIGQSAAASGRPSTDRFGNYSRTPLTPNLEEDVPLPNESNFAADVFSAFGSRRPSTVTNRRPTTANERKSRQKRYDEELTQRVWDLATKSAKPSVDLIVCFERNQPIGYQYADISREIVIRHGTKDNRVPLDNVKWLVKTMQKADLVVLEGEGHSLMGNAGVMAQVLSDIGKEWEQSAGANGNDAASFHSPILDDADLFD